MKNNTLIYVSSLIVVITILLTFVATSCLSSYDDHFAHGAMALSNENYEEAIVEFSKAIDIAPDQAPGYFWRGTCYYYIKQYDLAISDLTEAIELKDEYLDSVYNMRGLSYSAKGNYDLAISDFTKAIEIYPDHHYYHNRGLAYLSEQNYDLAIKDFSIAINLVPRDARLYSSRADVYIATGQTALAIIDLGRTIELAHNDPVLVQSARQRLEMLGVTE